MITISSPYNWCNLQDEVATILDQCGFHVETEKTVKTSRGKVELDVYAEEEIKGRKYSIVCECKYWKKKIPQSVIHSFRTVVADLGANIGYIISLKGFRSGVHEPLCYQFSLNKLFFGWYNSSGTWLKLRFNPRTSILSVLIWYDAFSILEPFRGL